MRESVPIWGACLPVSILETCPSEAPAASASSTRFQPSSSAFAHDSRRKKRGGGVPFL
jgi:hypothetical protein